MPTIIMAHGGLQWRLLIIRWRTSTPGRNTNTTMSRQNLSYVDAMVITCQDDQVFRERRWNAIHLRKNRLYILINLSNTWCWNNEEITPRVKTSSMFCRKYLFGHYQYVYDDNYWNQFRSLMKLIRIPSKICQT